jgi:hypothetical protein
MYDEFQQLNTVSGEEETEIQKLLHRVTNVMKENIKKIREMTQILSDTEDTIECSKCCRRFVHANGLYRHWDMHIGELLAESRPDNINECESVGLCVFCGEVFAADSEAWDHLVSHHVQINSNLSDADTQEVPEDTSNNDSTVREVHRCFGIWLSFS